MICEKPKWENLVTQIYDGLLNITLTKALPCRRNKRTRLKRSPLAYRFHLTHNLYSSSIKRHVFMWKTSPKLFFIPSPKMQLTRSYLEIVHIAFLFSWFFFSHYSFIITKWVFYYQDSEEWNIRALEHAWSVVQSHLTLWTYGLACQTPQGRILKWVVMPSSRGSSQRRHQTWVSWVSCKQADSFPLSDLGSP